MANDHAFSGADSGQLEGRAGRADRRTQTAPFAHTDAVLYVAGADNAASLRLHAALGFQEVKRFESGRSAAGVDVLSQLVKEHGHLWAGTAGSPTALSARIAVVRIGSGWTDVRDGFSLYDTARR
jgi:hypothetical protein